MPKKNVTFKDIAEYTGFSKTTISRYFNDPDSLTLENQQKIADALAALDYKENKVAKILANGRTEYIGIIIPNLYLHYYSEMLNQILTTYESYGYKFLVFVGNEQKDTERKYISELMAYKIEGMIILSHTIPSKELAGYNIPIVTIEREDKYVCSVNTDNYSGGRQAAQLLSDARCDVLIHINNNVPKNVPSHGRIKGFCDYCEENSLMHDFIVSALGSTYNESISAVSKALDEIDTKYPGKTKGIFMSNDTHANILLNILIRKHGGLPKDYKIVGFDGTSISSGAVIPISTVAQQIDVMAKEAMELLVMQIDERKKRRPSQPKAPIHKVVDTVPVRRETTAANEK